MILFGIAIGIIILCILLFIKGTFFCKDWIDADDYICPAIIISFLNFFYILIMVIFLLIKPYDYKNFKVEYETVKETITQKDDVRDATYTMQIIEINQKIRYCREFKDSKWIGIFQNKKICEMELLTKESE